MRIIIDIDGNNVNVTTEPAQKVSVNAAVAAIAPNPRPATPPELLAAAAALGAHDAGPAPVSPHAAGLVSSSLSHAELKAISGVTDAGSAPTAGKKTPIKKTAAKSAAGSKKSRA
jgi:hypothetical protein